MMRMRAGFLGGALLLGHVGIAFAAGAPHDAMPMAASTIADKPAAASPAVPPQCAGPVDVTVMPSFGPIQATVGRAFLPMVDPDTKELKTPDLNRLPVLKFTVDEAGTPINVSIQSSSRDRDVDHALLVFGRRVKFNPKPGCAGRLGFMPVAIAPA